MAQLVAGKGSTPLQMFLDFICVLIYLSMRYEYIYILYIYIYIYMIAVDLYYT